MHRRIALFAAVCLLTCSGPVVAQTPLSEAISTSSVLSDTDRSAIIKLIEESKAGLTGESDQIRRSRNALVSALRVRGTTSVFRVEYSKLLTPTIQPLAKSTKEDVAINAMRIAGEIGTRAAMDLLDEGLKDTRPGVRMMAALGYVRAFGTAREGSTPLIPAQVRPALDTIVARLTVEKDAKVQEALILAIESAIKVPDANIKDLSGWAIDVLAATTGKLAQDAGADADVVLVRATKVLFDVLSNESYKPSASALKESGGAAGDSVRAVFRRLSPDLSPDDRATLGLLADQAGKIYFFAAQKLGKAEGITTAPLALKLGDAIRAGNDNDVKLDAAKLFDALANKPFSFPASRFASK